MQSGLQENGQNTSYSRYLAAHADYNKAMENFKAMFYAEFGLFAEKKVREMIDKIKKLMGNRGLSELSKEELLELQELLFYFKHASKNKKLLASMSDLKIKYAAYQQRLKELKEDQTLIKYTDRDGKEIEITMAAAYERIII
jgi:histidyl-tRNA synthetase